jgi:hypothetical protein
MIQPKRKQRKVIGIQNGLKVFTKLQGKKKLNPFTEKQRAIQLEWSKVVQQKSKDLNFICQWCGRQGQPTKAGISRNCLTGHHIIKRRFGIHTYENAFICHWLCHDYIETHGVNVVEYPSKLVWEKRNGG